jgi:hypothetical protein
MWKNNVADRDDAGKVMVPADRCFWWLTQWQCQVISCAV